MPRTKDASENSNVVIKKNITGNTSQNATKTGIPNKKQGPVNIKVPTARQRAKEFDEGRRHDAQSNEL
jgi:hypothetical protein